MFIDINMYFTLIFFTYNFNFCFVLVFCMQIIIMYLLKRARRIMKKNHVDYQYCKKK